MLSSIVKRYMRDPVKTYYSHSIKNSCEILDKNKERDFNATSLPTYDFSTLCTTLIINLIKDKPILLTLYVMTEMHFYFRKN